MTKFLFSFLIMTIFELTSLYCQSFHFQPEWSKSAIWYQIFPERFFNGNVTAHPFNFKRKSSVVMFNDELFNHYKKIIKIRNDNECLSKGNIDFIDTDLNVLAYKRKLFNMELIVIANNQDKQFLLVLEKIGIDKNKKLHELYTGNKISDKNIILAPYDFVIIKSME